MMTKHIGNLAAFDLLVDTIRNIDNSAASKGGFNMKYNASNAYKADHPCGTACCIGGWASILTDLYPSFPDNALKNMVDIRRVDADVICYPSGDEFSEKSGWNATPEQAVSLLLHYRETGIVDWNRAMEVTK